MLGCVVLLSLVLMQTKGGGGQGGIERKCAAVNVCLAEVMQTLVPMQSGGG